MGIVHYSSAKLSHNMGQIASDQCHLQSKCTGHRLFVSRYVQWTCLGWLLKLVLYLGLITEERLLDTVIHHKAVREFQKYVVVMALDTTQKVTAIT